MNKLSNEHKLRLAEQRYAEVKEEFDWLKFEIEFRRRSAKISQLISDLKEEGEEQKVRLARMKASADAFSEAVDNMREEE